MEWKDATTYSRDQKDRKQTAWSLELPSLRIWVGCAHRDYPKQFIMHCHQLGFDTHVMNLDSDTPIEEVQRVAIIKCRTRLNHYINQLNTYDNENTNR